MMEKLWYKELGYKENPFTIKPAYFDDEIIGYDTEIDKLVDLLSKNKICFLEGEFGKGKTTIINYLINEFIGYNKIIKVSRNRSDRALNYNKLLVEASGFFGKLFSIKSKNVILIIDEVTKINNKDCVRIEKLIKGGFIKSVLFCDVSFENSMINDNLKKKIGKNIIKLDNINSEDAIKIVKSRLENENLISDDLIKRAYIKSNKNIRQLLINLDNVFRKSFELGNDKITKEDLEYI